MAKVPAAPSVGKALMRRLMGKKGGAKPSPTYIHPLDKYGPKAMNVVPQPGQAVASSIP
jgi:hypothetical protein